MPQAAAAAAPSRRQAVQEELAAQLRQTQQQQQQQQQQQTQAQQGNRPRHAGARQHASLPHSEAGGFAEPLPKFCQDASQLWADPSQLQPATPQPAADGRAPLSMADLKAEMAASMTKRG